LKRIESIVSQNKERVIIIVIIITPTITTDSDQNVNDPLEEAKTSRSTTKSGEHLGKGVDLALLHLLDAVHVVLQAGTTWRRDEVRRARRGIPA
jgi:hypothetical protein